MTLEKVIESNRLPTLLYLRAKFRLFKHAPDPGPQPGGGQPARCPPKFSKKCLVMRYNNKLQKFYHKNSATTKYSHFSPSENIRWSRPVPNYVSFGEPWRHWSFLHKLIFSAKPSQFSRHLI